jgi:Protein-tyrosine phosphatase
VILISKPDNPNDFLNYLKLIKVKEEVLSQSFAKTEVRKGRDYNIDDIHSQDNVKCPSAMDENRMRKFNLTIENLEPNTRYYYKLRVFTEAGSTDSKPIEFNTKKDFTVLIYFLVLLVTILVPTILVIVYKRMMRTQIKEEIDECNDTQSIRTDVFDISEDEMIDEFDKIQKLAEARQATLPKGTPINLNRYAKIFPFPENRVILDHDEHANEYINASYIKVSTNFTSIELT